MIDIINGNIFNSPKEFIICHQVNCKGVMSSGLAKEVKSRYPEVYLEYKWALNTLGSQLGNCQLVLGHDGRIIANLFSQDDYGTQEIKTDYNDLDQALKKLRYHLNFKKSPIALPYKIGCGPDGGDWDIVNKIILDTFGDYEGLVEIWKLN